MRSSVLQGVLFLTIGSFAIAPAPAQAQSIAQPDSWTVTPFLGFSFGLHHDSVAIGAAVAYDFTANLGIEGEFGHLFDVAADDADLDWSATTFSANAVYHFDVLRVTPYATAGLSLERSSVDVKVPDPAAPSSSTEIAWNFGAGAKYKIDDRWMARADLRFFQANDLAPDFWRLYGGVSFWLRR